MFNISTNKLSFAVWYVKDQVSIELFLQFIAINGHGEEYLTDVELNYMKEKDISLADCCGQSFDNVPNELSLFVPCKTHSFNLVGENAAGCWFLNCIIFWSCAAVIHTFFCINSMLTSVRFFYWSQ